MLVCGLLVAHILLPCTSKPSTSAAQDVPPEWDLDQVAFLNAARSAIHGGCSKYERRTTAVGLKLDHIPQSFNRTQRLLEDGDSIWHVLVSNAVAELVHHAMVLRFKCGTVPSLCRSLVGVWKASWCNFIHKLGSVVRTMPSASHVVCALGTTASAVIREALPSAIVVAVTGLANGKLLLEDVFVFLVNATAVFEEYVEYALVLGHEMRVFGRSRVARAVFHGQTADGGAPLLRLHRAGVLLGLVAAMEHGSVRDTSTTSLSLASPLVIELGINTAETSELLLTHHSTLRWIGVDFYDDEYYDNDKTGLFSGLSGAQVLMQARRRLKPWLGSRAQLIVAPTHKVLPEIWVNQSVDLVFVDADHSEAGASADLALWAPRVRPGGVVAGHDYSRKFMGVVQAAHAALPPNRTFHLGPDMVYWWFM